MVSDVVCSKVYRPRRPKLSPLWQCVQDHFYWFVNDYSEKYEVTHGFLKPIVEEVVNKYVDCGDLKQGFALLVFRAGLGIIYLMCHGAEIVCLARKSTSLGSRGENQIPIS